jgi:hypothetical protein
VLTLVVLPILFDRFAIPQAKATPSWMQRDRRAAKPAE